MNARTFAPNVTRDLVVKKIFEFMPELIQVMTSKYRIDKSYIVITKLQGKNPTYVLSPAAERPIPILRIDLSTQGRISLINLTNADIQDAVNATLTLPLSGNTLRFTDIRRKPKKHRLKRRVSRKCKTQQLKLLSGL